MERPDAPQVSPRRLLVIDDSTEIAQLICTFAEDLGCAARTACGWPEIEDAIANFNPEVIVLDLMMPDADGIEVLRYLADQNAKPGVILSSGGEPKVVDVAYRLGDTLDIHMAGRLDKPVSLNRLEEILRRVFKIRRHVSEVELEEAIRTGQIRPYYQSKVLVDQPDQVVGAELLARWHHPTHGVLPPMEFIGLAESTGLITDLTLAMLETALRDMAPFPQACTLSVNLSPSSLDNRNLPDRIEALVQDCGVAPDRVIFELTESVAARDYSEVMASLTRLRLKGFSLSMDDYGTGHSSLVHLVRLPFREIKLDRSFVSEIGSHRESEVIVRSTIMMAHSLKLTVCAEGVENEETCRFLRQARCDTMQGFLISKPIPGCDFFKDGVTLRRGDPVTESA